MPTYEYDLPFQRRLLAAAWSDSKWWRAHREIINPDFFSDEILVGIARTLHGLSQADRPLPDLPAVLEDVRGNMAPGRSFEEYDKQARIIWKLRGTNTEFYQQRAVDFARRAAMAQAVEDAHSYVATGELEKVQATIQRALKVGGAATGRYDFFASAADRAKAYASPAGREFLGRVSTGFAPVDQETHGGLGPGEVGCFLGLAGHGKSTALVAGPGRAGILSGKSVLHVSLENSVEITAAKYDCTLLEKTERELAKLPKTLQKKMAELSGGLKSKLQIVYAPDNTLTLGGLESIIESAGKVDVVLLDYAAKMRAGKGRDEKRHELEELFVGLRGLAGTCGVPIWTAHQSNKAKGQRLLTIENFQECFALAGVLDLGVSVNYDETRPAEMLLYVMKNRMGRGHFEIPCEVDFARCYLRPLVS